jgi:hypothetical protein
MARSQAVSAEQLEEGDDVVVHVNERASEHLGTQSFEATVTDAVLSDTITFRATEDLEKQGEQDSHTWYTNIGYIHGYNTGLERYSDIGKVRKVTRQD